jgi:Na+-transporting methylmalonyl-CoA/oxaloacetate decarboxylase gamma subunit
MATMQGIYITALGMVILFAALLILMLAAMVLERLFRPKEIAEEVTVELQNDKELVAAIAVALALNRKAQTSNVKRQTSKQAVSVWKSWGRYRQLMSSREVRGRR